MKMWLMIVGLALVMTMPSLATLQEIDPMTDQNVAKSQTRFYVTMNGKKIPAASLRSVYLIAFVAGKGDLQRQTPPIEAVDFEGQKRFNAYKGYYVVGTDVVPKGSMKPHFLSFSSLERATDFWKRNRKPGARYVNLETATLDVIGMLKESGVLSSAKSAAKERSAAKHAIEEIRHMKEIEKKR